MRKLYLLLLSVLTYATTKARVSVTATAGTTGPTSYATVKAAFDAINAGTHKGAVTIAVTTGTTETASAVLNASGTGSSSYTSVLLRPAGGAACTITGDIATNLIDLDGADNVTINGLNTGGNALTISNTNTGATASTIRFINDASNNTITNASILGAGTAVTVATIFFSTGNATGNDNNTISNNNIADNAAGFPANAILSAGTVTAGQENSNNAVSGNNIYNFFSAALASTAVLVNTGNTDWNITNNKFYQTAARSFTAANTHRVIQVSSGNNHLINQNTIGYAASNATGVYSLGGAFANKFVAIELTVGTTTASTVQDNIISSITLSTTSNASATSFYGVWCGIYVIAGSVTINTNTIGSSTGTGSIVVSPTVNGAFVPAISTTSTGTVYIWANSIGAMDLVPTGVNAGTLVGIITGGASGTVTIDQNMIGNATANNMKIGIAGTTTQSGIIRGILNSNAGTVTIIRNTIRNMIHNGTASTALLRGIEYQSGSGSIFGNTISDMSAGGTFAGFSTQAGAGIVVTSQLTPLSVDSNTIYSLSLTNATGTTAAVLSGIYAGVPSTSSGIVNGLNITRNRIYNLSNAVVSTSATAPAAIVGVYCGNANTANPLTIANNMIALGSGQTTNTAIIGIMSQHAAGNNYTARIYHNSIDIEGTVGSGSQPSFGYYRGDFSATTAMTVPTVDIRNNIFMNNRSGGTGKHYAIANGYNVTSSATGWPAGASDYNVFSGTETTLAYWGADLNIGSWKTASSGDAHSVSAVVNFVSSPSNLHLISSTSVAAFNTGTPLSSVVPVDIDNDLRLIATPDIGADEFNMTLAITMEYFNGVKQADQNMLNWKAGCSSPYVRFEIGRSTDGKNFTTINTINATKDRCATPFNYADTKPAEGINYYRLKIVESDGSITYSPVIAIINRNSGIRVISLSPTIIERGTATLEIASAKKDNAGMFITDMQGKISLKRTLNVIAGSNKMMLDLSSLAAGSYSLQLYGSDGEKSSIRFIKQ